VDRSLRGEFSCWFSVVKEFALSLDLMKLCSDLLEDVVHFPKSQYSTKITSPYLLKITSPIESHFNKVEKGKGQKPLTVM